MMALGRLLEVAVMVVLVLWVVTQILIPLIKGTRLFPIFNKRRTELEDRLEAIRTRAEDDTYEQMIERLNRARWSRNTVTDDWRDDADQD